MAVTNCSIRVSLNSLGDTVGTGVAVGVGVGEGVAVGVGVGEGDPPPPAGVTVGVGVAPGPPSPSDPPPSWRPTSPPTVIAVRTMTARMPSATLFTITPSYILRVD
jgi:hypothetical protein